MADTEQYEEKVNYGEPDNGRTLLSVIPFRSQSQACGHYGPEPHKRDTITTAGGPGHAGGGEADQPGKEIRVTTEAGVKPCLFIWVLTNSTACAIL